LSDRSAVLANSTHALGPLCPDTIETGRSNFEFTVPRTFSDRVKARPACSEAKRRRRLGRSNGRRSPGRMRAIFAVGAIVSQNVDRGWGAPEFREGCGRRSLARRARLVWCRRRKPAHDSIRMRSPGSPITRLMKTSRASPSWRKATISPRRGLPKRNAKVLIRTYSPDWISGSIERPETSGKRMKKAATRRESTASCNTRLATERHRKKRATRSTSRRALGVRRT